METNLLEIAGVMFAVVGPVATFMLWLLNMIMGRKLSHFKEDLLVALADLYYPRAEIDLKLELLRAELVGGASGIAPLPG